MIDVPDLGSLGSDEFSIMSALVSRFGVPMAERCELPIPISISNRKVSYSLAIVQKIIITLALSECSISLDVGPALFSDVTTQLQRQARVAYNL